MVFLTRPYERLSKVYDGGWSDFSIQYGALLDELLRERDKGSAKVLDLGCGTGTLARDLAGRGHRVHGIDSSPEMIALARAKCQGSPGVSFEVQDMGRFKVAGKFDLVTCVFDAINYLLDTGEVREMFRRITAVLLRGGFVVFDCNTRSLYRGYAGETREQVVDGHAFIQQCTYDPVRNEATTVFSFWDGTCEIHRQRPYELEELEPVLRQSGLSIAQLFSWFDRSPFSAKTEKLFCVAEKRGG